MKNKLYIKKDWDHSTPLFMKICVQDMAAIYKFFPLSKTRLKPVKSHERPQNIKQFFCT